ncbi:helix-turn-helix domain-containing protein [Microlunatus endophyticus]|uniref:helix-turn-helix domain-containing protein n=1 Tax=Microlunatus endophyticus TaxID=1716077 RepID=UPI001E605292|nr:helix-turn-helix domain-containing protein [Microlunatus endophyticus]
MNLRDPATESFTPTVARLVAGEFDVGVGYATYRSRGTTDWLLIHTLAGEGRLGTDGPDVRALPDTTTLVRPATRHDYGVEQTLQHWHFLYVHFHPRPDWDPLLVWPEAAVGIGQIRPDLEVAGQICTALRDCVRHDTGTERNRELSAMNALEAALLLCDTQHPVLPAVDERVQAALKLIADRLAGDLDVARLAAAAGLSASRFAHLFRSQLGVSPQQFVERRRLESAARLLDLDDRPIGTIAAEVGFTDPIYFSTRFRRWYGVSPRGYRDRRLR